MSKEKQEPNIVDTEVLYKNLRRPEVDKLFQRKQINISKIEKIKLEISGTTNKQEIAFKKARIEELQEEADNLDKAAKLLWKEIQELAKQQ